MSAPGIDVGRHAAPPRRGLSAAVAAAVIAIGAGTWVLGSGPDEKTAPEGAVQGAVVPEVAVEQQAPALSVAPAPSEAAYAAARRASERASRAGKSPAAPKKKSAAALGPAAVRLVPLERTSG